MTKHRTYPFVPAAFLMCATTLLTAAEKRQEPTPNDLRESALCKSLEYAGVAVDEPGYHIWGTSPIMDDAGKVHLFVARFPNTKPFDDSWRQDYEIAHYIGDTPEGPFAFVDVALKGTGKDTWDRYSPFDPLIVKVDGQYVLFYVANAVGLTQGKPRHSTSQRIGMATSKSLGGPWKRVGMLLGPSEDAWFRKSSVINPAFIKHPDGRYLLYFRAGGAKIGLAVAEKLEGPYVIDNENYPPKGRWYTQMEDGHAFMMDGKVYLLTTDNQFIKAFGGGLLRKSADGTTFDPWPEIGWRPPEHYLPKVNPDLLKHYFLTGSFQRPHVLMQDGRPTHIYVASGTSVTEGDGTLSYILEVKRN